MLPRLVGSWKRSSTGTVSAFMRTVLDDTSGSAACITLGAVRKAGDTLTGGFILTPQVYGTVTGSNQTIAPAITNSNFYYAVLNGSSLTGTLTFDVPSEKGSAIMEVVNGGSGAVGATLSTSGYTKVDGTYATTNGNKYLFCIIRSENYKYLNIVALQ